MLKQLIAGLMAAGCILSAVSGLAYSDSIETQAVTETKKFSYLLDGNTLTFSADDYININSEDKKADILFGVYDGDMLIKTAKITTDEGTLYSMKPYSVQLNYVPDNLSVKAFIWSADGKCEVIEKTTKTVLSEKLDCDMISQDTVGTDYVRFHTIPVYKSESSLQVKNYSFSNDAQIFINGFSIGNITNEYIIRYMLDNNGSFVIKDFDGDGYADRISVDYYIDAVVDSVSIEEDTTTIHFKSCEVDSVSKISWDPDTDAEFTHNGEKISAADLQEYDVLKIKYDVVNAPEVTDSAFYDVIVSRETVNGKLTSKNSDDYTVAVDGNQYKLLNYIDINDMALSSNYTFYLDSLGHIAYYEYKGNDKLYGIITGMYISAGSDYAKVKMITADAEIVNYECKDTASQDEFYRAFTGDSASYDGRTYTKSDYASRIREGKTVVSYDIFNNRIKFGKLFDENGGNELEYKAESNKLGLYTINDAVTKMVYIGDYLSDNKVYSITSKDFTDSSAYGAYLFDMYNNDSCKFVIVTDGITIEQPEPERVFGTGIITGMYQSFGNDYATVRMITSDAEIIAYECKDTASQDEFYRAFTGDSASYDGSRTYTKSDYASRIREGETVCKYEVTNGKIKLSQKLNGAGGMLSYDGEMLAEYSLSDVSNMIDLDGYISGADTKPSIVSIDTLEKRCNYTAYLFDTDSDDKNDFVMFISGIATIQPPASMGIVKRINGTTDVDGTTYIEAVMMRGGKEQIVYFEEDVNEGDVLAYTVGNNGYVETYGFEVVYNAAQQYNELMENTVSSNDFNALLNTAYANSSIVDVNFVFGAVYSKNDSEIKLITKQTNGNSDISECSTFNVDGANEYTYNYANKTGYRADIGGENQSADIYNTEEKVNWSDVTENTVKPQFALLKEVDGEVIDVFYYNSNRNGIESDFAENNPEVLNIECNEISKDDVCGTSYVENGYIPVYESKETAAVLRYKISIDTKMYVNGIKSGFVDDDLIEKYILENQNGKITLKDADANGIYDIILIDYYLDAIVDTVSTVSDGITIYFKTADYRIPSKMSWNTNEDNINVSFMLDGNVIQPSELKEYDVLSIAYDAVNEYSLTDLEYYEVMVSRDTVSGSITTSNRDNNTITMNGEIYNFVDRTIYAGDLDLGNNYKLYLDAFGKVMYCEEDLKGQSYGVIVSMYTSAGNDYATVRMITADAQVVAYECKDETAQNDFFKIFTGKTTSYDGGTYSKTAQEDRIKAGDTVVQYTLSSNKIRLKGTGAEPTYGAGRDLTYNASSAMLGGYTLNKEVTKLIDIDSYLSGSNSTVATLSIDSLEDGAGYLGFLVGKTSNGYFRLGVIYSGASSLRDDSTLAIVQKFNGIKEVDGINCKEYFIARDAKEYISVLFDESINLNEGDIISYLIGSEGYVDDKFIKVYSAATSYESLLADMTTGTNAPDNFSENLAGSVFEMSGTDKVHAKANGGYTLISSSKPSYIYFGPVYKKSNNSLELFSTKSNGVSNITDVISLSVAGANQYVFDFSSKSKYRVSVGTVNQNSTIFPINNFAIWDDFYNNCLNWSGVNTEGIQPAFALVKEIDGEVVDVFYVITE